MGQITLISSDAPPLPGPTLFAVSLWLHTWPRFVGTAGQHRGASCTSMAVGKMRAGPARGAARGGGLEAASVTQSGRHERCRQKKLSHQSFPGPATTTVA